LHPVADEKASTGKLSLKTCFLIFFYNFLKKMEFNHKYKLRMNR
jgi:hypothetical protein